jgi:NTE family protein
VKDIQGKIGVALSGGGYRAAAYHIGTLKALNRLGILDQVDVISAVSGGSIAAAYYALHKEDYERFEQTFVEKLQRGSLFLSAVNLIAVVVIVLISAMFLNGWMLLLDSLFLFFFWYKLLPFSCWIENAYSRHFFEKATLSDLPSAPLIAINATDVATGTLFTFSQMKMAGYKYEYGNANERIIFKHEHFPVAKAVMASSCVPFAFSPITIGRKYYNASSEKRKRKPLLIDGGLYDNQGAHKLGERNSTYHVKNVVVSDAGAEEMSEKLTFNVFLMLKKTADILMNRIKTFQMRNNIYADPNQDMSYAYLSLGWDVSDRPVRGFINNITTGNIAPDLLDLHRIEKQDLEDLKSVNCTVRQDAEQRVMELLKRNVNWDYLETIMPTQVEDLTAKTVRTSLSALKEKQIHALIKHSNWLTEVQVRLYLPHLLTGKGA